MRTSLDFHTVFMHFMRAVHRVWTSSLRSNHAFCIARPVRWPILPVSSRISKLRHIGSLAINVYTLMIEESEEQGIQGGGGGRGPEVVYYGCLGCLGWINICSG